MGTMDIPPSHIPSHTIPISTVFLQIGGMLWTLSYILYVRESFRSKSYGMPLFAIALDFGWEVVYSLVADAPLERMVFRIWLVVNCGMIFGMLRYARFEWRHAPVVRQNITAIFAVLAVGAVLGQWAFASWWIRNEIGKQEGKFYKGVIGPDMTELMYWSTVHSGGVSWGIWGTRTLGSIIGFYFTYGWYWYFWREAHEYFMSPFSVFMWGVGLICDCLYPFVLWQIKDTEIVLEDGRKIARAPAKAYSRRKVF